MTRVAQINDEVIESLLGAIRLALESARDAGRDVVFNQSVGMDGIPNYRTGYMEHSLNGTQTIQILIDGGARDKTSP